MSNDKECLITLAVNPRFSILSYTVSKKNSTHKTASKSIVTTYLDEKAEFCFKSCDEKCENLKIKYYVCVTITSFPRKSTLTNDRTKTDTSGWVE